MTHPDAFALKNSRLNAFLFADVGTELNGSALTVLSVLGRLGKDPWAEAGRWASLPKAAAIDCLAGSIARMPLRPQALADSRIIASKLVLLLPVLTRIAEQSVSAKVSTLAMPRWTSTVIICCALALGLVLNVILMPRPTATVATPSEKTAQHTP